MARVNRTQDGVAHDQQGKVTDRDGVPLKQRGKVKRGNEVERPGKKVRKAQRRLKARQDGYDALKDRRGYRRPGSLRTRGKGR